MPRLLLPKYILLIFFASFILQNSYVTGKGIKRSAAVQILSSSNTQLEFEFSVSKYKIERANSEQGKEFEIISIPDYDQTFQPGMPRIPVKALFFSIPAQQNSFSFTIQLTEPKSLGKVRLPITPRLLFNQTVFEKGNIELSSDDIIKSYDLNPSIEQSKFFPSSPIKIDSTIYMRGQRLARILFFPVRHNPLTGETEIYTKAKITINFRQSPLRGDDLTQESKASRVFDKIIENTVINPENAATWKTKNRPQSLLTKNHYQFSQNEWYKIIINDDAIYRITATDLQSAGLSLENIDPRNMQIFNKGVEIPVFVSGENDGKFDNDDYIEFLA